jgi:dimethylargininase
LDFVTTKLLQTPFVMHDAGVLAGAVVLRPSTSVERLVPLAAEPSPIAERAIEQHAILVRTLRDRGVDVTVLESAGESPAQALVGDLAIVLAQGAVVTRPSTVERRPQTVIIERALEAQGIPILGRIAAPGLLDAGDVALAAGIVYVGVPRMGGDQRARSNASGRAQLAELAAAQGLRTIEVGLAATVLRLRNVLTIVGAETAIVAPDQVDVAPLDNLRLVEVPLGEQYAAGVLPLGERRVLANLRYRESLARFRKAKIAVEAIDLWEFGKVGAGPFSLVLALKRR